MNTVQLDMPRQGFRKKFIGDKSFYKMVLGITIPMMLQNGITNFVNMLDNIMVGRVGTEQMSGVSISNQIFFIYMLAIFGGLGGIGIFTAQFCGKGDTEGVRITCRAKLLVAGSLSVIAAAVMLISGGRLVDMYLNDASVESMAITKACAVSYMRIMLLSMPGIITVNTFASMLRECGQTKVPMKAGIAAVLVNLVFNWLLIFGKLGFPKLGVQGAAIATVLSRYVESAIIVIWMLNHKEEQPWVKGLFASMKVPAKNLKAFAVRGTPLLMNEFLWSTAMALLTQSYSLRGLSVVAALNIANTINNLSRVLFMSMGNAVSIIVGQQLGAGDMKKAKDYDNKIFFFSVLISLLSVALLLVAAPLFPRIYNTGDDVRALASDIILVYACMPPIMAFVNCAYFTMRCGGKTFVTFLFDSVFTCVIQYPLSFVLSRFTGLGIIPILICVNATELLKCALGYILIKKNVWIHNIVSD